ncbi:heavy metal translocating P-type ATPase [Liquorilactobacillus vini]|uniref:Cd(2+)-exporting ATPase n=1 Tax=Liquorilactobacillus vini DSM 20605 TaxID=1133569 RepID=A0A0R2BXQ1_9LACO|nr:heavy metal translocating P-type ATPase [Liquorilactobacillus vini]KRM84040.1 lead, cadmium, zinc and mercury transporting ATPase [Liquorilactobacillus vini DSM 20605]
MKQRTKLEIILLIGAVAILLQFILHQAVWAQIIITLTGGVFALIMFWQMIQTLRQGKYGVDLLAITAIVATLAVGEYWAAMIILIMLIGGESLEEYATQKAGYELKSLIDNSPQIAHRIVNHQQEDLKATQVQIGDQLIVKPSEIIPVDGHVLAGEGNVDESSLTGESRPVSKRINDPLLSGAVNGNSVLRMQVDRLAQDSQYQQLVKLVKISSSRPARFVRLADRYALPFTLAAYVIAGFAWFIAQDPVRFAEVLVVASPCPLILAAPVALVSGMSRSSRNGIVVKTGDVIEKLATAKTAIFDKTGTVTRGYLTVDQVKSLSSLKQSELLSLMFGLEQNSNHILARSLVKYAQDKQIQAHDFTAVSEIVGQGVTARQADKIFRLGKLKFAAPRNDFHELQQTAVFLSCDQQLLGYVTFADEIRPEAAVTMKTLKKMGIRHLMMLTGDQAVTAQNVAQKVAIADVRANLLPQAKIAAIEKLAKSDHPVIMVGDGVNDAPSLTVADVGIAMGAHGSSAASESADVVILKDDLSRVAKAVKISQTTMRVAKQAVLIGIFICLGLMLIATTGVLPTLIGALLQELIDTVSILWALKARKDN